MDWIKVNRFKLDKIKTDWTKLDKIGPDWTKLDQYGSNGRISFDKEFPFHRISGQISQTLQCWGKLHNIAVVNYSNPIQLWTFLLAWRDNFYEVFQVQGRKIANAFNPLFCQRPMAHKCSHRKFTHKGWCVNGGGHQKSVLRPNGPFDRFCHSWLLTKKETQYPGWFFTGYKLFI